MCLAIPARILELLDDHMAQVSIMGTTREISLDLTPSAHQGDYVLVHAGFAIEIVDEQYARETLAVIQEMGDVVDTEELMSASGVAL